MACQLHKVSNVGTWIFISGKDLKNEINSIFFTLALNFKHYNLIKFKRSRNFLYLRQALGYGQGVCFWCFHKPLVENSLCTGKKNTISMLEEIEYKVRKGFSSNRIETNIRDKKTC